MGAKSSKPEHLTPLKDLTQAAEPAVLHSSAASQQEEPVHVTPSDVVIAGSSVITLAAVISAIGTYRKGSKSLLDDGINPSTRMRMIPIAAQTLMLSTLFTGVLGVGGFYVLRAAGLFKQDVAELPSAAEAKRMLTQPRAYIRDALSEESKQQSSKTYNPG